MKKIENRHKNSRLMRRVATMVMAGVMLLGACTKDEDGIVTLKVNTENYRGVGKAYVDDDLYTCWSDGDAVRINGVEKSIVINTVNNQTTCYIDEVEASATGYWSIFPSSIASSASYSNGTISGVSLPETQVYTVVDGKQMVPTVMTAYLGSSTGTISYHNACIALRLTLTNNYSRNLLLSEVKVSDDLAPLNGTFRITGANGSTPALVYDGTVADANKSVTLSFGESGLSLNSESSVTVFVILPPTSDYADNKFTIGVTATDGASSTDAVTVYEFSHTQSSSASGAFARNTLAPINISLDDPHTMVLKGLGTQTNPYKIYTADDLQSMQNLVAMGYEPIGEGEPFASAYYQLMNNISLTAALSGPIGTATNNFTGHFVGQNHTLTNLTTTMGLFGYVSEGATIEDLKVNGATVSMTGITAGGVICARATQSVIDHCQVTGTVSFTDMPTTAAYIGGIVGDAMAVTEGNTMVRNCHNGATMTVSGATAAHRVGGIAGHLLNSAIYNSYTMLNTSTSTNYVISAENAYVGGIVGRMDGDAHVINCYYGLYDNISGTMGQYADLCGEIGSDAKIYQCYYRDKVFAIGTYDTDNQQAYPYYGQNYQIESTGSHVGTLLNATVTSLGTGASLDSWTVPNSTSAAPTLTF